MKKQSTGFVLVFAAMAVFCASAAAQGSYKQPPKEIMDVLNAPAIPTTSVSPTHDKILLSEPLRNPPGSPNAGQPRRLNLTAVQKAALVAFMRTLTDTSTGTDVKFSDPFNYGN